VSTELLRLALLALVCLIVLAGGAEARYASIVVIADTGEVLHATNADTRNYPASLTKMMTLYLTFEALEDGRLTLDQRLTVSRRAAGMTPSRLGLNRGETVSVEDLILALVTKSANDAAVVLAEALGGTEWEFALLMTREARAIGMSRTTFRNASGLHSRRQLSSARDMATLARALLRDFPGYYHYFSVESFTLDGRNYHNHNGLLSSYAGTDGIKTGYLSASGFNLVASTVRNGRRLIAVVFGGRTARSRDLHMVELLDRAFALMGTPEPVQVASSPGRKPLQLAAAASTGSASPAAAIPEMKPLQTVALPARKPIELAALLSAKPALALSEPAEKPVKVAASSTLTGPWGVQVGAFYRYNPAEKAALRAAGRVPELLGKTQISITHIKGERGRIYRARLVGLNREDAEAACRLLASVGIDCFVVRVGRGATIALNIPGEVTPALRGGLAQVSDRRPREPAETRSGSGPPAA
jgi:D-alanyl-D-alanine carboxypeptidase